MFFGSKINVNELRKRMAALLVVGHVLDAEGQRQLLWGREAFVLSGPPGVVGRGCGNGRRDPTTNSCCVSSNSSVINISGTMEYQAPSGVTSSIIVYC